MLFRSLDDLQQELLPVLAQRGFEASLDLMHPPVEPFKEAEDSELLHSLCNQTGQEAQVVSFATEAPFLKDLQMETIVMGPGSIDQAHQPDEYLDLNQIDPGINLLTDCITRYCMQEGESA